MRTDAAQIEPDDESDLEQGIARQERVDKPPGLDVAGVVMQSVSPVTAGALALMDRIIERCVAMKDSMVEHERAVAGVLGHRDDEVRRIIKAHGSFAALLQGEGDRIAKSLDEIEHTYGVGTDKGLPA